MKSMPYVLSPPVRAKRDRPSMRGWFCAAGLSAGCLLGAGLAQAAPPPHAQGKGPPAHAGKGGESHRVEQRQQHGSSAWYAERRERRESAADVLVDLMLAGVTRDQARQWASTYGHVNVAALPPGIQRNLARGKPLPPGIAKQAVPDGMLARLPRYEGYEWVRAGSDLLLVVTATQVIADVLNDVFR